MRITAKGGLVIFLIIQLLGITILRHFPDTVERFYSNGLYLYISKGFRYAFGWLPFSFGDIAYTLGGLLIIRWLIKNRKRIYKDTFSWLGDVLATLSLVYFAFHILWAYNYYRLPLHKSLDLKADYTTEELLTLTKQLIETSNAIHQSLVDSDTLKVAIPYSKKEIYEKVPIGYETVSQNDFIKNYIPLSLKNSLYSLPLTYMGFSGYLNPFTNEAQVNSLIPDYKSPVTACHEVAHQVGYAAENEANFIGALVTIHHPDAYFQYAGYTFALRYCLSDLYKRDKTTYETLVKTINKGILKNFQESREFWLAYENPIEPLFKKTYDTFLKANSQTEGIKSYSYVVALLVNYFNANSLSVSN